MGYAPAYAVFIPTMLQNKPAMYTFLASMSRAKRIAARENMLNNPPPSIKGRRLPILLVHLSDKYPTTGAMSCVMPVIARRRPRDAACVSGQRIRTSAGSTTSPIEPKMRPDVNANDVMARRKSQPTSAGGCSSIISGSLSPVA